MKIKIILTVFLPVLLFTGTSCNSPTEPKDNRAPDTTSHNFVWRVDTLGSLFSWANCVEIVNENDIWVGGNFYGWNADGSRNSDSLYNLAHWNGVMWEYLKIRFQFNDTSNLFELIEITQIKYFGNGNFLFLSDGSTTVKTDFKNTKYKSMEHSVNKFFSRNEHDIYFAGNDGCVLHYDGVKITKIESGTQINLLDIWGDENKVYVVGENGHNSVLVEITGLKARVVAEVPNNPDLGDGFGVMMSVFKLNSKSPLWILGGTDHFSLFEIANTNPFSYKTVHVNTDFFPGSLVRASATNDIYLLSSSAGQFVHYNGKTWKEFIPLDHSIRFWDFKVKGNIWANVGDSNMGTGVVIRGKRL